MVPYLLGTDMPTQTASKEVNVSENMEIKGSNNTTYGYRHAVMVKTFTDISFSITFLALSKVLL